MLVVTQFIFYVHVCNVLLTADSVICFQLDSWVTVSIFTVTFFHRPLHRNPSNPSIPTTSLCPMVQTDPWESLSLLHQRYRTFRQGQKWHPKFGGDPSTGNDMLRSIPKFYGRFRTSKQDRLCGFRPRGILIFVVKLLFNKITAFVGGKYTWVFMSEFTLSRYISTVGRTRQCKCIKKCLNRRVAYIAMNMRLMKSKQSYTLHKQVLTVSHRTFGFPEIAELWRKWTIRWKANRW